MTEPGTTQLKLWIDGLKAGDPASRERLIQHACERMRVRARQMLRRDYARLRGVEQTDDVLQNALLRLHRALQDPAVQPASVAEFFRLASLQIRRELLDLARRHFGPSRPRPAPAGPPPDDSAAGAPPLEEVPGASTYAPDRLLEWHEFHACVEALPDEERQVFELLWYQELTQAEAAAVLQVSIPTIKRRWLSARLHLQKALPAGGAAE